MPPRTFSATSPAPLVPRVATVTAPTRPMTAGSPTTAVLCSALSGRPLKARHHCDSQRRTPGRRRRKPWSAVAVASRFPTALESSRYLVGQRGVCARGHVDRSGTVWSRRHRADAADLAPGTANSAPGTANSDYGTANSDYGTANSDSRTANSGAPDLSLIHISEPT